MTFFKWSQTANTNGTADGTCPWPEGMAPSQVNDSARGGMAALAKYRDDVAGITATGGTSSAYTFASFQGFDSLAHMANAMIVFVPHATNAGTCTLNVDGLGAQALHSAPSVELLAGTIIAGTPYCATYYNSNQWILHGFYGNPYNIPLLGGMDYWDTVAPNSSFIFPQGQAISRTTYATAFARLGTTYGAGDGSTTFNVPNKMGRVSAMLESSAVNLTNNYFGNSTVMGTTGGSDHTALVQGNLPVVSPTFTGNAVAVSVTSSRGDILFGSGTPTASGGNFTGGQLASVGTATSTGSVTATGTISALGSGIPLANVPPLIICNYIMRII